MLKLLPLALAFATTAAAMPAPTAAQSKWKNADETDSVLNVPVCRAFVQAQVGADTVELSIAVPKDGKTLPMISLRTKLAPPAVSFQLTRQEREFFYLLKPAATNQDASVYWYAPVNVAAFEQLIRDGSSLPLTLDPKSTAPSTVLISLVGSTNALEGVQKCLKTVKEPADFYKLLNAKKDDLTPDLGDRSPQFLFQTVQNAYAAYLAGQGIAVEIAALRAANAPLLKKEASAKASLDSSQKAFDVADLKLKTAETLVTTLTTKLDDDKAALAALTTEKPLAEADLAAKKATYLPLKAQMVPYDKAVSDDTSNVKKIQASITQNENLIARNTKLIPQLESESASLRRQLPGLQSRVNSTKSDYDDADYKYRHYDVNSEYNSKLNSDAQYNWAKNDYQNACRDLDRARGEVSREQGCVSNAQSKLNSCKAGPNNPPCSSEQSELSQAQSRLQQAEMAMSSAQSKQSSAQWTMSNRESSIRSEVQSVSDDLQRKRNYAESDYESAVGAYNNAVNRISEIRSTIPQLRAQIDKATALLPQLRDQLANAQAVLQKATDDRAAFSDQIGFGAAEKAFFEATQHLADVNAGIARNTKEIPQLTKDLAAAQKTIPVLTKAQVAAQATLDKAKAVYAPIEAQLQPFKDALAVKQAALDAESGKFKTARAAYQDLLKLL